jgi:hypothetical protein
MVRAAAGATGHRHGYRLRSLLGSFGQVEIAVPRARLNTPDGKTTEWKSKALRAYQRRTLAADALIASTYLAGTNTLFAALFGGAVGKDIVSRVWRKVKSDWDAWNARSLANEPIVRLILDGTVVRVRLDRKATSISLLVVIGVREDGQKVLLAIKSMGGESAEAWRTVLDDLIAARAAPARVPHRRRRGGARQGHRRRLGRRAGPALHGSQAQEPAGARARAPARGDHRRLQRHDLRGDARGDRERAARPSSANGGSSTAPSPTAWRKPATVCSPSPACRRANGAAREQRTRSSVCTRSSSGGSRRRSCCLPPTPRPCCSGRCSLPVRSTCAKSMAGRRSPQSPSISRLTSPLDPIPSCYRRSREPPRVCRRLQLLRGGAIMSNTTNKFSPEVRQRAVRSGSGSRGMNTPRAGQAIMSIAAKIGCTARR